MIDPLGDGALDNTLGQSAFGWFENPSNPLLDRQATAAFRAFVNAYVHVPRRHVPLPHNIDTSTNVREPFIMLWQEDARYIRDAASPEGHVERSALWQQFTGSVTADTNSWSKWIRFQWTPEIIAAFKARVPDWKNQFKAALEEVRPAASSDDSPIPALIRSLNNDFGNGAIELDRDYRQFARKENCDIAIVACAYGWSWFCRGASYCARTHGMSVWSGPQFDWTGGATVRA